jgi:hypothetical protein
VRPASGSTGDGLATNGVLTVAIGGWRARELGGALAAVVLAAIPSVALAQPADGGAAQAEPAAPEWRWGPSIFFYILSGQSDYLQPTLTADRGGLHLDARYNYEDRETASVFAGWNFSVGDKLKFAFTPMLGGVFGRTNGIAPGLTFTLSWGPLSLWSQSEYVFAFGDFSSSYLYNWSELAAAIAGWLHLGVALQRTKVFETPTEVQVGPFVGFSFWKLTASAYLFAPAQESRFGVIALAGAF